MKFDVELPMKFPYLTLQMWDRDVTKVRPTFVVST